MLAGAQSFFHLEKNQWIPITWVSSSNLKLNLFPDSDVWRQFDFSYRLLKSASSLSNIMDYFGISSRRRDCIDFTFQILLLLWNKISASGCFYFDSPIVGVDNNFGVNYKIFNISGKISISINVFFISEMFSKRWLLPASSGALEAVSFSFSCLSTWKNFVAQNIMATSLICW